MSAARRRPTAWSRSVRARVGGAALVGLLLTGCQAAPVAQSPAPAAGTSVASPATATTSSPSPPQKAAELRRIAIPALDFDEPSTPVSTAAMGNAINPPLYAPGRPSSPVRVSDKGVQPSADASDTVYVGCHTSTKHGPDQYPCDVLTRRVKPGMQVVATTAAGTLIYTVTQTRSIPYGKFAVDEQTWRVEPRRLVFVMCDILDGVSTQANYVIYASLPPTS